MDVYSTYTESIRGPLADVLPIDLAGLVSGYAIRSKNIILAEMLDQLPIKSFSQFCSRRGQQIKFRASANIGLLDIDTFSIGRVTTWGRDDRVIHSDLWANTCPDDLLSRCAKVTTLALNGIEVDHLLDECLRSVCDQVADAVKTVRPTTV